MTGITKGITNLFEHVIGKSRKELTDKIEECSERESRILNKEIDYVAIMEIGRKMGCHVNLSRRFAVAFHTRNIYTYNDLLSYVKERRMPISIWKEKGYVRSLGIHNVGVKHLIALYCHLDSLGISLYGGKYTQEELGRSENP